MEVDRFASVGEGRFLRLARYVVKLRTDQRGARARDRRRTQKKWRGDQEEMTDAMRKAQLDAEMDAFLAEDDTEPRPPSPPSKMRADFVNIRTKSLLERTSELRQHPISLENRPTDRRPRRSDHRDGDGRSNERVGGWSDGRRRSREGGSRRTERPRATQEELDAELDAFLNSKDDA